MDDGGCPTEFVAELACVLDACQGVLAGEVLPEYVTELCGKNGSIRPDILSFKAPVGA